MSAAITSMSFSESIGRTGSEPYLSPDPLQNAPIMDTQNDSSTDFIPSRVPHRLVSSLMCLSCCFGASTLGAGAIFCSWVGVEVTGAFTGLGFSFFKSSLDSSTKVELVSAFVI